MRYRVVEAIVDLCAIGFLCCVRQYLLESGQEAKAGLIKEKEGDYRSAINLYLKVQP